MKFRDKIFLSIILILMAIFITFLIFGSTYKINGLTIAGIVIMVVGSYATVITAFVMFVKDLNKELKQNNKEKRTLEDEEKLLKKVATASNKAEREMAKAVLVSDECDSVGELVLTCFGLSKSARSALKSASLKDKIYVYGIYITLALCFIIFFVGTVLLRIGPVGFILLGVSVGLFLTLLVVNLIITKTANKNYFKNGIKSVRKSAINKKELPKNLELKSAIVKYSYYQRKSKKGVLYNVMIYNEKENKSFTLLSQTQYEKGEIIEYYDLGKNNYIVVE